MVLVLLCHHAACCVRFDTVGILVHASLQVFADSGSTSVYAWMNSTAQGNRSIDEYNVKYIGIYNICYILHAHG